MAKKKKGFNWKARQVVTTVIDNSETQKIQVDIKTDERYDQSNQLVLPSKKRETKVKTETVTRILSKKHRKRLEKIVQKKKKKEQRASLLESLQKVQASKEELSQLTSIASIQTKGLKRYFHEELHPEKKKSPKTSDVSTLKRKINSIRGAHKKIKLSEPKVEVKINDPNIVGFDSTSDSSDSEREENSKEEITNGVDVTQTDIKIDNETKIVENNVECIEIADDSKEPPVSVDQTKITPIKPPSKPAVYVDVIRNEEIQMARLKLPILAEEQQIMEAINENSVIIIAGETGSGKTTQVPQFLYEAGYALEKQIVVTEPRRVAAISMSQRVAHEMNLSTREVSYLIRFEGNVTEDTKIKFMTDGVLLKELQSDFLLTKYSVVIIDEAHERSAFTDILIGCLCRIVPSRQKKGNPLKLIIMSATLRLEDFTKNRKLFKIPPPVIKIDARQFPVTVHFNKTTKDNYMKEAFNKAVKIHTTLPEGGILIFVTGQQEVNSLVRKLRKAFPLRHKDKILKESNGIKKEEECEDSSDAEVEEGLRKTLGRKRGRKKIIPEINLDEYGIPGELDHISDEDFSEDEGDSDTEVTRITNAQPLWVLPLYSMIPSHKQQKVMQPPPPGCRLCVVSTNVAETSLTIPGIKYVIDTGKQKLKLYDKVTGVTRYVVHWTSKASANQRTGRAGRVGPGHCYRLYSSAVFNNDFQEYSIPEIQQKPVDDIYLKLKCMHVPNVMNFPFVTPPDMLQLKTAVSRLELLGALEKGSITPLGRMLSKYPVLPRFGKMLAFSHQNNLAPYAICLVAALSVQEVLLEVPILETSLEERKQIIQKWASTRRRWVGEGNSLLLGDNMVLLKAVITAECENTRGKLEQFCNSNGLRHKAIVEIRKLRIQLTNEIQMNIKGANVVVDPKLEPPTDIQAKMLRQLLLMSMGDQIARKIPRDEIKSEDRAKFKYAYRANNMEDPVFLHQGSVLRKVLPEFVVYQEIYETNKMYMRGVTAIQPEWLPNYVPHLCNLFKPLITPEPKYNPETGEVECWVTGTIGPQAWPLPLMLIPYPVSTDVYNWFAKFLLEGKVFTRLEKNVESLLSSPSIMVKTWAKLQQRTVALHNALLNHQCYTKQALVDIWTKNPKYLLAQYLDWLPQTAHAEVSLLWPPLDKNS